MLRRFIKLQTGEMLCKKATVALYIALLCLVLYNFLTNVFTYKETDVVGMIHPMKLLLLSRDSRFSFFLLMCWPLLVVLPAGFGYLSDKQAGEIPLLQARVGWKTYLTGKCTAAFIATFLVFTLPFLIEIGLNCLAFPLQAIGDIWNHSTISEYYVFMVRSYLFHQIYLLSPYLYAVLCTLLFGLMSGILAVFTVAVSTFSFMKYKILAFIPGYVLLSLVGLLRQLIPSIQVDTHYYYYLSLFSVGDKSTAGYLIIACAMLALSVCIVAAKSRKDFLA